MAGVISVTPEELESQAKVYTRAAEMIDEALRSVGTMNGQIAEEWKGQAFQAYLSQFERLSGNVRQMEDLLRQINAQLERYAQTTRERDIQDAQAFGL